MKKRINFRERHEIATERQWRKNAQIEREKKKERNRRKKEKERQKRRERVMKKVMKESDGRGRIWLQLFLSFSFSLLFLLFLSLFKLKKTRKINYSQGRHEKKDFKPFDSSFSPLSLSFSLPFPLSLQILPTHIFLSLISECDWTEQFDTHAFQPQNQWLNIFPFLKILSLTLFFFLFLSLFSFFSLSLLPFFSPSFSVSKFSVRQIFYNSRHISMDFNTLPSCLEHQTFLFLLLFFFLLLSLFLFQNKFKIHLFVKHLRLKGMKK